MNTATEYEERITFARLHAATCAIVPSPHSATHLEERWGDLRGIMSAHPVEMGVTAELAALLETMEPDPSQRFKVFSSVLDIGKFTLTQTAVKLSKASLRAKLQNLEAVMAIVNIAFYGTADLEKLSIQKRPAAFYENG